MCSHNVRLFAYANLDEMGGKRKQQRCERANEYSKRHTSNIININEFYDMEIKLNKSLKANKQNVSIHMHTHTSERASVHNRSQ